MVRAGRSLVLAGLLGFAALFVVLHFQLARGSRFVPDDLSLFASVRQYGALWTQWVLYKTWSGRWASNLMVSLVMSVLADARSVFPYAIALLAFAVGTAWLLVRMLLADRVRAVLAPLLAVVTVALLFFATPDRGDSWFFVFCSLENVLPLGCALVALACVLRAEHRPRLVVPAAILAAVATACHEAVALTTLAVGGLGLVSAAVRDRADPRLRTGAWVLATAGVSFAVSAASPGSATRLGVLPRAPLGAAAWNAVTGGPGVLLDVARAGAPALVTALLVWMVAGNVLAPAHTRPSSPAHVLRLLAAILVVAPIVALAATFPGYYALGAPPPARAQLVLGVFLLTASVALGGALGSALRVRPASAPVLVLLMLCSTALVASRETARMRADIATARAYALAYDARITALSGRRFERGREPIVLEPLPPSGVLRSAEISTDDPGAHANRSLRRMMRLRRPVLRAKDASATLE